MGPLDLVVRHGPAGHDDAAVVGRVEAAFDAAVALGSGNGLHLHGRADEAAELGYIDMFADMFGSLERGVLPAETFYDGYIVNEITDACYRSARSGKWEPVELKVWRGREKTERISIVHDYDDEHILVKEETLPDGRVKKILKNRKTGEISELSL